MITCLRGVLEGVEHGAAHVFVEASGLTYEVLLTAYAAARLGGQIGQPVILHTLHFMESQNQGATILPRLAGFLSVEERQFFEVFITCKGIGHRKALRALALRTDQVAAAIVDRDVTMLTSLPEIGRRTAETIVATLHGKVDRFITSSYAPGGPSPDQGATISQPVATGIAREALDVLMKLGENRLEAMQWIDRVLRESDERPRDVEDLLQRIYLVKAEG